MLDMAKDFLGKVTFITGPGKHCGKTTFMNRAAVLARRQARKAGSPGLALLTVGYDGEVREFLSGTRKPAVPVEAGDIVLTTENFARSCAPEILDLVPGSTALGKLCIARAGRAATVALVGPEGNSMVAWSVRRILEEGFGDTVFVDGAINRLTQVASIPGAQFVYVMHVEKANLERSLAQIRRMSKLGGLPIAPTGVDGFDTVDSTPGLYRLTDALTVDTAARIPATVHSVVVEDLTKVFLSDAELAAFQRDRTLLVERSIGFSGFVVSCRGISDCEFVDILADSSIARYVFFNPYETAAARVA